MTAPQGIGSNFAPSPLTVAGNLFSVEHVGPGGPGSLGTEDERLGFTKIKGEKLKATPMVPAEVKLSEEMETRLVSYLNSEVGTCEWERMPYVEKMSRLKQKYRTKFPEFPKDFPIPNASQITIPVIKSSVNTLSSRLYQTVMAAKPLASVRTKDPMFQDFANDWELFLDTYSDEKLEVDEVLDTAVTECIKLGTSVVEVTRHTEKKKLVDFDFLSQAYQQQVKETFNGPILYNIPIEDFWIRPAFQDVQKAPWCGKELRLSWSEIKDMALSGELNPEKIDHIWNFEVDPGRLPKTVTDDAIQEKTEPSDWDQYRIFELCVRWDVDGDGYDEELILYWHHESRTILRKKFNTFRKGRRPYAVFRYVKIEYRFYGEGLAEMLEHLQEEISTQHNQRLDNAVIASLKLILTARSIKGLRPGDPVWPGKIVRVGNAKTDVDVLTLGEIYPSTVTNEQISQSYAREVSGVGEVALGQAQPVSRTTAAAQLSLLEELNRRFDKTLKGFRKTISEIFNQLTDLFNQTGTNGLAERWLGDARGQAVEAYITLPPEHLLSKIKIQVTSTKATINREVEMQSNIAIMNLIIQQGQQLMALCEKLAPQVLPIVAHEIIATVRPIFKKVLQYADAPNPDEGIRVLAFLESILPSPEDMGGMQQQAAMANMGAAAMAGNGPGGANGAGGQQSQGTPNASWMEDLMQTVGNTNRGMSRMARQR